MEWHSFALLVRVPQSREAEWTRLLRGTPSPAGIQCTFNESTRLLLSIEAEMEFMAIEKAQEWLESVASRAFPAMSITTNAQPANEIDL